MDEVVYMNTATTFFCTHVEKPDIDDYKIIMPCAPVSIGVYPSYS
jgi:hypothetical protein